MTGMDGLTPTSERAPERGQGLVVAVAVLLIVAATMLATAQPSFGAI
jgi:hypothetical protein